MFDLTKHTNAVVGRKNNKNPEKNPLLIVGGIGILEQHAVFETTDKGTVLKPLSKDALEFIFINGRGVTDTKPVTLKPNDRIVFGTGSVFLFKHDANQKDATRVDTIENAVTYEFAMKEKHEAGNKKNFLKEKFGLALDE